MARNANNQAESGGGNSKQTHPALDGNHAARIVQVIFLGVQEQRAFQGTPKPPIDQIRVTYELSHEFMLDEDGNAQADKPLWQSETLAFHNSSVDLATSTKRFKAYRPDVSNPADFVWDDSLLGLPVQVVLKSREVTKGKHAGKTFTDVKGVSSKVQLPGYEQPELVNPAVFFDPADDDVDVEVFNALPDWLQDQIKGGLDYATSPLSVALAGGTSTPKPAPAPAPKPAPQAAPQAQAAPAGDEDTPY